MGGWEHERRDPLSEPVAVASASADERAGCGTVPTSGLKLRSEFWSKPTPLLRTPTPPLSSSQPPRIAAPRYFGPKLSVQTSWARVGMSVRARRWVIEGGRGV